MSLSLLTIYIFTFDIVHVVMREYPDRLINQSTHTVGTHDLENQGWNLPPAAFDDCYILWYMFIF